MIRNQISIRNLTMHIGNIPSVSTGFVTNT
ncbi:hypothetical protein J2Z65_002981 [Paenibacillus aceris]|uniref:Uncharacterized protein n=1 Tax=Paenibacillus aceris TaxID=869555 RepID=A0ABS4HYQ4_9BACL|nr:hypothetical protein [Paenibacillus aceris]